MPRVYRVVRDSAGNAIASPTVTVYDAGTSTPRAIFSDDAMVTPLTNPFTGNTDGTFEFWTGSGEIRLKIEKASLPTIDHDHIDLPVTDHGDLLGLGDDDHAIYHNDARALTWLGTRSLADLGTADHGVLSGLGDDDHPQYHNDARALTWLGGRSLADLGTADHGVLSGRSDDDHAQYALLAGRSGGQVLSGGSGAGEDLTIEGTTHATPGDVLINPDGGDVVMGGTVSHAPFGGLTIRPLGDDGTVPTMPTLFSGLAVINTSAGGVGNAEIELISANDGITGVFFGDEDQAEVAWLSYEHDTDLMKIASRGTIRMMVQNPSYQDMLSISPAVTVLNEEGADHDLRVEGVGQPNLLFCDAGTNRIGIGTTPASILHIKDGATDSDTALAIENDAQIWSLQVRGSEADRFAVRASGANRLSIDTSGRVGIGTGAGAIATSAILELSSTTGALLLPRMTTTQRNALTAVDGMLIYNTTTGVVEARESGAWVDL